MLEVLIHTGIWTSNFVQCVVGTSNRTTEQVDHQAIRPSCATMCFPSGALRSRGGHHHDVHGAFFLLLLLYRNRKEKVNASVAKKIASPTETQRDFISYRHWAQFARRPKITRLYRYVQQIYGSILVTGAKMVNMRMNHKRELTSPQLQQPRDISYNHDITIL